MVGHVNWGEKSNCIRICALKRPRFWWEEYKGALKFQTCHNTDGDVSRLFR